MPRDVLVKDRKYDADIWQACKASAVQRSNTESEDDLGSKMMTRRPPMSNSMPEDDKCCKIFCGALEDATRIETHSQTSKTEYVTEEGMGTDQDRKARARTDICNISKRLSKPS